MSINVPYTPWADLCDRLLQKRIICLSKAVDEEVANQIIAMLLHLELEDPGKDIQLQINSTGGSMRAALAIADTLQQLDSNVVTVCVGSTALASTLLLAVGTAGKRLALPNARIRLQQPTITITPGKATDIEVAAQEILYLRRQINAILAQRTGQPLSKIERDMERSLSLSASEALEYGLVDRVVDDRTP